MTINTAALKDIDSRSLISMAQAVAELRPFVETELHERTGGWVRISSTGVIPVDSPTQTFRKLTAEEQAVELAKQAKWEAIEG